MLNVGEGKERGERKRKDKEKGEGRRKEKRKTAMGTEKERETATVPRVTRMPSLSFGWPV